MATDSRTGSESDGLPHYTFDTAPRHMRTKRQLWDGFGLLPGGPARATVDSQYGPAALYDITESRLPDT